MDGWGREGKEERSLPEGQKEISGDMRKLILCEYSGDLMKDDDKRRVKEG